MGWPRVDQAKEANRAELCLNGASINESLKEDGFDVALFELTNLNYLDIHDSILDTVPDGISSLKNLQTLVLHNNKLTEINVNVVKLSKLKLLDLSRNALVSVPSLTALSQLETLNVSMNQVEVLPSFAANAKLKVLNASNNKLREFPSFSSESSANLLELLLDGNVIEEIPSGIGNLTSLKTLNLSSNKIKVVPGELADCNKLKDLNLKVNPVSDRRLFKLIDQLKTKQVIDYIKQHCPRRETAFSKKDTTTDNVESNLRNLKVTEEKRYKIHVRHFSDDQLKVVLLDDVKAIRPYILSCIVENIKFNDENLKKFIQVQTKIHENECAKRTSATIATHDFKKLGTNVLTYTAVPPKDLLIKPLGKSVAVTGAQLYKKLQEEAENLRKEKKRNVYTGIHKYLYMLEGKKLYPCIVANEVVSFPPITNSDVTKISTETGSIFLEVTSSTAQEKCKLVLDALLKEMLKLFGPELHVQQVRVTDTDGNLKAVYPSRCDLNYSNEDSIEVVRA